MTIMAKISLAAAPLGQGLPRSVNIQAQISISISKLWSASRRLTCIWGTSYSFRRLDLVALSRLFGHDLRCQPAGGLE